MSSLAVGALRLRVHWSDRVAHAFLIAAGLALAVFLLAPLFMILAKSVEDRSGEWVGFLNFADYFRTPRSRVPSGTASGSRPW
jgi:iron(III) transport system permease protein